MLAPGTTISGLRIDALIGRGAMGEVYRGEQLALRRPVAIKRIADHIMAQDQAVARFQREAQCLARVQSPHVVAVHDFGHMRAADGSEHWLLVMELVEGGRSLRAVIGQSLPWAAATAFALHIAHGLAAAAELGIIHRDVKPDNVIVSQKGVAKLVDFGLARAVDSTDMTIGGSLIGTPTYMSPEACRGETVDARSDLYSLGATWYHLLAGRAPFSASNTPAMLLRHLDDEVPPLASIAPLIPPQISALVHKCLAKHRDDRPASAEALVDDIIALVAQGISLPTTVPFSWEEPHQAAPPTNAPPSLPPSKHRSGSNGAGASANNPEDAATAPTRIVQPGSAATAPTLLMGTRTQAPRPRRYLVTALALGAFIIGAGLAHVLLRDPFPAAKTAVLQACINGDYALALRMADALIAKYPTRSDALQLDGEVIARDVQRVIASASFDQARALLAERRKGREWFDGEPLAIAIDLAQAQATAAHGDREAAIKRFQDLRDRHPKNLAICLPLITSLGADHSDEILIHAALDLAEGTAPPASPPAEALDVLTLAHQRWNPDSDTAKRWRAVLIKHRPQLIAAAHTAITTGSADDPDPRVGAYLLLKEAGALSAEEELCYHLRNVIELEDRFSLADESLTWLSAAVAAPDWKTRKAAAKIAPFADVEELHHTGEREARVAKLLVQGFVPEITDALPKWIALTDEDHEDLRFNAWRLQHDAGLDQGFDDFAFHATTLRTFNPWSDSPQLEAALDYFSGEIQAAAPGFPAKGAAIRDALLAGDKHVEDLAQMVARNMPGTGRAESMREIGEKIRKVRETLPKGP